VRETLIFHQRSHSRCWAAQTPVANGSAGGFTLWEHRLRRGISNGINLGKSHSRCVGAQVRGHANREWLGGTWPRIARSTWLTGPTELPWLSARDNITNLTTEDARRWQTKHLSQQSHPCRWVAGGSGKELAMVNERAWREGPTRIAQVVGLVLKKAIGFGAWIKRTTGE